MKRKYVTPQTDVCNIMTTNILTTSTSSQVGGDADENGRARIFDGDDE